MKATVLTGPSVLVAGCLVCAGLFEAPRTRSLARNELWRIRGGQIEDRCCDFAARCIGPISHCNGVMPMNVCLVSKERVMQGAVNDDCERVDEGEECGISAQTHPCYTQSACTWNTLDICVIGGQEAQFSAPDECDDSCAE